MGEEAVTAAPVRYRRRKILVDPGYQLRVALVILLSILLYSGLLAFLLFYPLMVEFEAAGSSQEQFWIAQQVLSLHQRFWPSMLAVALLASLQSLFVTHRVVGPAFHLRRVIQGLAEGKIDLRARLRRWDRLKDVEAALNGLADRMQEREEERLRRDTALRAAVGALVRAGDGGGSPAARQALQELERLTAEPVNPA
jgi:hypothetical protein